MSDGTEIEPVAEAVAEAAAEAETLHPPSLFDQLAARRILNGPKGAKFGITRAMLGDYLNRRGDATPDELEGITKDVARDILYRRYWLPIAGDRLPEPVAALLFDVAVRRGVEEAGKLLQEALTRVEPMALAVDGRIGAQTLTAIGELVAAGKAIAIEERVLAERTTARFRLGDGKFFGRDVDLAGAVRLAGIVGKGLVLAKTGVRLP